MPVSASTSRTLKIYPMNPIDYKKQDREHLLSYLEKHPISRVDTLMAESGAERLRIYPLLFELTQEKKIRVVKETEWGAPSVVELIVCNENHGV